MRELGANTVRLYGNNPTKSHRAFFDEAHREGLRVVPGLSDWPYMQMDGACSTTNFDCFQQIKESYLGNLRTGGWLLNDGSYHPALEHVVVVNEPELKLPSVEEKMLWTRAVISGIDGMIEAEREAGMRGGGINFTVTYSFAMCFSCILPVGQSRKPALGQMLELRNGMLRPAEYGYSPRNDLAKVFATRFTNSFNTANAASELDGLFFDSYNQEFRSTPVFIGEFHSPHPPKNVAPDLLNAVQMAERSPLFIGISFFEFQVRYDKGGAEMDFGMFGLGEYEIEQWDFDGAAASAWCLVPVTNKVSTQSLPDAVAFAFGGQGFDAALSCVPHPDQVPLDTHGHWKIFIQNDVPRMDIFVQRLVEQAGGVIVNEAAFSSFVKTHATFNATVEALASRPSWATWGSRVACVADRDADIGKVGRAIEHACMHSGFDCSEIPPGCKANAWHTADYILGIYYKGRGGSALENCYFEGAARLAAAPAFAGANSDCIVSNGGDDLASDSGEGDSLSWRPWAILVLALVCVSTVIGATAYSWFLEAKRRASNLPLASSMPNGMSLPNGISLPNGLSRGSWPGGPGGRDLPQHHSAQSYDSHPDLPRQNVSFKNAGGDTVQAI